MVGRVYDSESLIQKAADIAFLCDEPMATDTRIALRRKLNGDSR